MILNSPIINITATSTIFSISTLSDGTYFWSVQVRDSNNWGVRSSVWSFTIDTSPTSTSSTVTSESSISSDLRTSITSSNCNYKYNGSCC
jgi:hypothetical protein